MAVVAGVDHSHGDFVTVVDTLVSAYMNIEVFGLQKGFYIAQACMWKRSFMAVTLLYQIVFPMLSNSCDRLSLSTTRAKAGP